MAAKNDKSLNYVFETTLKEQEGFSSDSIIKKNGSYVDSKTAVLFAAFKEAYRQYLKHHVDNKKTIQASKIARVIAKRNDNGFFHFTKNPYFHTTKISADEELERLANKYPDNKFGVFALEQTKLVKSESVKKTDYEKETARLSSNPRTFMGEKFSDPKYLKFIAGKTIATQHSCIAMYSLQLEMLEL